MSDRATPNLPSRDFQTTADFYGRLGFSTEYRDGGWMILARGDVLLEFFPFPDLDPATSSFGCCLRLDDVDDFYERCRRVGIRDTTVGWPRIHQPRLEGSGLRIGALLDPDGTLVRLVQNP
jgi:catechol 2,3-dioxygenase-like lactoylglutathione lyase family enzyme